MDQREIVKRKIRELENSDPKNIDDFLKIEQEINRLRRMFVD